MSIYYPVVGDSRISSTYGGRSSPGGIGTTNHKGIDIAAPTGAQVIAPVDMEIVTAGKAGGFGNLIQGRDASGNTYQFGHLSDIDVAVGDKVSAGYGIGNVGSTGNSTGQHLHFGIKDKNGNYINPASLLANATAAGSKAINATKKLLGIAAVAGGPVTAVAAIGSGMLGGKSWLEQFREWLAKAGFFTRLAMVLVALIFFGAAFALLAKGQVTSQLVKAIK